MVIFSLFLPLLNLSALKTPCGSQFGFSTQEIKPNFLVTPSPTQHHSFFRNVPTLFSNRADGIWLTDIFLTVAVTSARLLKRPSWLSKRPSWLSKRPSWLSNVLHRQQFFRWISLTQSTFLLPSLHHLYWTIPFKSGCIHIKSSLYAYWAFHSHFFYEFASVFILFHFCWFLSKWVRKHGEPPKEAKLADNKFVSVTAGCLTSKDELFIMKFPSIPACESYHPAVQYITEL